MPKAVMLSNAQAIQMTGSFPSLQNPTNLSFSPVSMVSGMASLITTMANASRRVITKQAFSPPLMVELIEKYKVAFLSMMPTQVSLLLQSPAIKEAELSSVRCIATGGEFMSESMRIALRKVIPNGFVPVHYAMTELGGMASIQSL